MKLNKRIKQLRLGLRQNQDWMAKELNISKNHYSRVETGKSNPSLELLKKISEVTNTKLTVLLEDGKPGEWLKLAEKESLESFKRAALDMDKLFANDPFEKEIKQEIIPITPSKKFNLEDAVKKNAEKIANNKKKK